MIGLAGAHRTGKTTLARLYADASGLEFAETSSSKVFEELGLDPKVDYDFGTRLKVQNAILDAAVEVYKSFDCEVITDRTPMDMLGYTMADITRSGIKSEHYDDFMAYQKRCYEISNQYFAMICVIQPGIKLIDEEGKAPADIGYIEHLNALIKGLILDEQYAGAKYNFKRQMTDLQERMLTLDRITNRVILSAEAQSAQAVHH